MNASYRTRLYQLGTLLLVVVCIAPLVGEQLLSPTQLFTYITGSQGEGLRLLDLRIPRVLTSLLVGGGLAISGLVFQVIFRNDLATPFTLGVASAGALGAYIAILVFARSLWAMWFSSFIAGLLDVGLVVAIIYFGANQVRYGLTQTIVLAGVMLSYFFAAITLLLRYIANPFQLTSMEVWTLGSLQLLDGREVAIIGVLTGVVLALYLVFAGKIDLLAFDDDWAKGRGLATRRLRILLLVISMAYTSVLVALTGPIGFVGLLIPHIARQLVSGRMSQYLLVSFLLGGIFLITADAMSRLVGIVPGGAEVPIGLVTAFVGVPFFVYVLAFKQR